MPFEGSLEDLSVVDILQLFHFSRKSGTLRFASAAGRAVVVMRDGDIVGVTHPDPGRTVGALLRASRAIDDAVVHAALERQRLAGDRKLPFVATLVEMGAIDREIGWHALSRLVEETVVEIVGWTRGTFAFDPEAGDTGDDFRHCPEDIGLEVNVDTQHTLMEALRILDERGRGGEPLDPSMPRLADSTPRPTGRTEPPPAVPSAVPPTVPPAAPPTAPPTVPPTAPSPPPADPAPTPVPASGGDPPVASPGDAGSAPFREPSPFPAGEPFDPDIRPSMELAYAAAHPAEVIREPEGDGVFDRSGREEPPGDAEAERLMAGIELAAPAAWRESRLRRRKAALVTGDGFLKLAARNLGRDHDIDILVSEAETEVRERLEGWILHGLEPVLVVDLVDVGGGARRAWIGHAVARWAARQHPEIPVIALSRSRMSSFSEAFRLGAQALLPRPVDEGDRGRYVAQMKGLAEALGHALDASFERRVELSRRMVAGKRQLAVLRERMREIRFQGASPEIALVVLRYVAEFLERCVVFLVRQEDLLALGAFGMGETLVSPRHPLAGFKLPLRPGSLLHGVVREGRVFHGTADDPVLREQLFSRIGPPRSAEAVMVPLRTASRTVAVIYGDFGERPAAPVQLDALEILAGHASLAMEAALARLRECLPADEG